MTAEPAKDSRRVVLVIPTYNAAAEWPRLIAGIRSQRLQPKSILVIDSSSSDGTAEVARASGCRVETIAQHEFSHGGTRQMALKLEPEAEFLVYLTQDAAFADPDALVNLLEYFSEPSVAIVYGRQLPRPEAGAIEAHARLFNYPAQSQIRSLDDRARYGIKTIFCSNSFAAYRRAALEEAGGFPDRLIHGEDTVVAARVLLHRHRVAYAAEARVFHSHSYSFMQEFRRYFDTGVLHRREAWLQSSFGTAGGEGRRFIFSELRQVLRHAPWLLPVLPLRTAAKLAGYRLGLSEHRIPAWLKPRLSMNRSFWQSEAANPEQKL